MASESTYGQKPIYYGSKSPMYYGNSSKTMYSGSAPYYSSGGGAYYSGSYYGRTANAQDSDSIVGTITFSRILRVVAQRWISVFVFLLVGLVAAFAVYRISPTIYEAQSEFTMDMRRPQASNAIGQIVEPDYGSSYGEIFNTRLSDWRSDKIVTKIVQQYRTNYPASTVTDAEIISILGGSNLELVKNSRLITISVRSRIPALAAALANAYAAAIESFTDDENKLRCDKAVAQIHDSVEKQRRADEKITKQLLEFRTANKIDNLKSDREIIQQSMQRTTTEILRLQTEITAATEWEKVLQVAQEVPENFGSLPTAVPRSSEIGASYTRFQNAKMELTGLLAKYTKSHPEVKAKEKERETLKQQFVDAVSRALATAHGNLASYKNQLAVFQKQSDALKSKLNALELKIVEADAGIKHLEQEKMVSTTLYTDLMQKEHAARIVAEQNNEIVRVGRPAVAPSKPVLPNPTLIFAAGIVLSLVLGLLFVLVLDHLEDTIVSLSDIESRLGLKVLVVLPHVRRKKREQVAKFIAENKYSAFAEAMAGLRNMLDSPRYQQMSQVLLLMSTQPGEGKTITSCSLAISSAQAGKKTLLVDFDLRRPRLARVWGIKIDKAHSFSHYLASKSGTEFEKFAVPSGVENLDVIVSLPPDDVDPASIMGSAIISEFFKWARDHYERIVIDSPPYGIVGDVMTLASMVDSVMIMCCPDRTHFKPIQHASRVLAESGATVIGIVVNDVDMAGSGSAFSPTGHSGYGYYGGYGGYKSYGSYRPYAPYAPLSSKKKKDKGADADEAKSDATDIKDASDAKTKDGGKSGLKAMNPDYVDEE